MCHVHAILMYIACTFALHEILIYVVKARTKKQTCLVMKFWALRWRSLASGQALFLGPKVCPEVSQQQGENG